MEFELIYGEKVAHKKGIEKMIFELFGFLFKLVVGIAVLLLVVRIFGPATGVCRQEGSGDRKVTICPADITFKGSDLLSPLRVGIR